MVKFVARVLFLFLLLPATFISAQHPSSFSPSVNNTPVNKWASQLLTAKVFVENKGQFEKIKGQDVLYYFADGGTEMFFTKSGLAYKYNETVKPEGKEQQEMENSLPVNMRGKEEEEERMHKIIPHFVFMDWKGAAPSSAILTEKEVPYYYTYPDAKDESGKSSIKAKAFEKIIYKDLYPGIDVEYSFPNGKDGFKYDVIVHPGADASKIKMNYSGEVQLLLDKNDNLQLQTPFGNIVDHAPFTYYANGFSAIFASFHIDKNCVSFDLSEHDDSKTVVIDPWTTNPAYPGYNAAYDVEYDFAGNVYVFGGASPYKEIKLNSSGVIQWVYTAALFTVASYYGDFCVDGSSGSSYIAEAYRCCGLGTRVIKLNSGGTQVGMFAGNPQMQEFWRVVFNNCTHKIILVGSSFINSTYFQACTLDTSVTTITPSNVLNVNSVNSTNDMCLLALDNSNNCFMASCGNKFLKCPANTLSPTNYLLNDNHNFTELNSIAYIMNAIPRAIGMNGMAVSNLYLYTYDGKLLQRWKKSNGAFMNSVLVTNKEFRWGGVAVDDCDNIYVGKHSSIIQYDTNFTVVNTIPMAVNTDTVYDVRLAPGNLLYACGLGFVSAFQLNTVCNPLTLSVSSIGSCSSSGSATVVVTGGTGPYTYSWSPTGQTTSTATGLSSGTYTVTVTDASCIPKMDTAIVVVTNSGNLAVTTSQTNVQCSTSTNGDATVNVSGGSSPYVYSWSPSGGTNANATGLAPGNYTCVITDNTGCSVTQTFTITAPPALTLSATPTNILCNGNTNGSASANAGGGTGPYTYSWNNSQTTATATGLGVGTYTIYITDANGCTDTATVSITQPSVITANASATNTSCGNTNGTATVNASGGTGTLTYSWAPSGGTNANATGLGAGGYTVYITDANGCTQTASVTVNNSNGPNASIQSQTNLICNGINNGSASITVVNGTSPYTYAWSPSGGTNANASGLAAGNYTVTITDASGCSTTQVVTITQPSAITATPTTSASTCNGSDGSATANASGGTGPLTYSWSNSQTTATATGLAAGNYSVTVTDANGCTQIFTAIVSVGNGPTATAIASSTTITAGQNSQLTASGGVSYSWSPSSGLSCTTCANPVATPAQTTTYCVQVTDANGCTDSACVTIVVDVPCDAGMLNSLLPNAFSPNGNGMNDALCVPANACIKSFILKVYDRWGEKVFETESLTNCWDGTYKGSALNTSVFVYFFEATLSNGDTFKQKGNISLIK